MNWIDNLMEDYYSWLKNKTSIIKDTGSNWVQIQTPFIGIFNDLIEIYVSKSGDKIILSDNGETFHNLELIGVSISRSQERRNIVQRVLLNYGIHQNKLELTVEANEKNFAQKKHNLLSAIIELNDLYVLSKPSIASIFKDDVRLFLDTKNIIYTPDFISKGSTGLEFMFDFQLAGKNSEIVIKSFNTMYKDTLSSFLFSWEDIKPVREKISKKSLTAIAIINDTEKQVKSEFIEALTNKNANYIIWSDRDKEESVKKLQFLQ